MKRIKLTRPIIRNRAEAEALAREIAECINTHRAKTAEMDAKITAARAEYEAALAMVGKQIAEKTTVLQTWADANPTEFDGAKSLDMTHAVIGYRTGQPQIKTVSGWTWDRVLEKIKAIPSMLTYVRTKEELNKQALISDRDIIGPETLRALGCRVLQEESFFVEPKLTEVDSKVQQAA